MSLTNAPMFASLPAHDIERARRWYEEKLGLTPMMDLGLGNPDGGASAWFTDSEGNILAVTQMPPGMTLPAAQG